MRKVIVTIVLGIERFADAEIRAEAVVVLHGAKTDEQRPVVVFDVVDPKPSAEPHYGERGNMPQLLRSHPVMPSPAAAPSRRTRGQGAPRGNAPPAPRWIRRAFHPNQVPR